MSSIDTPPEYKSHLKRQGFILGEPLGQGLSGSVYSAEQPSLNRMVAVKFFDSAFVRNDEKMCKRFMREAQLLAKFQHQSVPYILTEGIVDAKHGKSPYFVMEYVDGNTLDDILRNNTNLPQATCVDYTLQILEALRYAHAHQIIHRDVKPSNIIVDKRGRCFLIDFSIGVSMKSEPGLTRATSFGEALGTTAYVSPEQLKDASNVDRRTDIYAMGVVFLEMLTGRNDRTNIQRMLAEYPHSIASTVEKACRADREDRFRSIDEFIRSLGGDRQVLASPLTPALAICTNVKCKEADWTSRGYYRGPKILEKSTKSFCTSCGEHLTYNCSACGVPISNAPYCGNCGHEIYKIPECEICKSWLTIEYISTNGKEGCRKCVNKKPAKNKIMNEEFDDDIPF